MNASVLTLARDAMLSAGYARIRPVLMTASAMILGMLPMALGLGEGGEQNAPLGRAVIGGLMGATMTTLFVVPIFYTYLRTKPPVDQERRLEDEERNEALEAELDLMEKASEHSSDPSEISSEWDRRRIREQQLRREVEDLKRQLREQQEGHAAVRRTAGNPPASPFPCCCWDCFCFWPEHFSPASSRFRGARRWSAPKPRSMEKNCRAWK